MRDEHLPRWRLIRLFLSVLVGFMAGLAGWMLATLAVLFTQGQTASAMRLSSLPMLEQAIAFLVPAGVAGAWLFSALGSSH
jgi:hypothetical protein